MIEGSKWCISAMDIHYQKGEHLKMKELAQTQGWSQKEHLKMINSGVSDVAYLFDVGDQINTLPLAKQLHMHE